MSESTFTTKIFALDGRLIGREIHIHAHTKPRRGLSAGQVALCDHIYREPKEPFLQPAFSQSIRESVDRQCQFLAEQQFTGPPY